MQVDTSKSPMSGSARTCSKSSTSCFGDTRPRSLASENVPTPMISANRPFAMAELRLGGFRKATYERVNQLSSICLGHFAVEFDLLPRDFDDYPFCRVS